MKYIVFTYDGHGLPIAHHLQQEGHDVIVGQVQDRKDYLSKFEQDVGDESAEERFRRLSLFNGILDKQNANKVVEWMKTIKDPENYFVFFDVNNLFKFSEQVMDLGFKGNFPTEQDLLYELDRDEAKKFVKKHYPYLNVAEVREFDKISEAKSFLQKTDDLWVLKGNTDSARTVVPDISDPRLAADQILEALESTPEDYEGVGFILELMIPSVVELTPEIFFYDGVPIGTSIDIENKPIGSGNLSIQTGCASDLVFPTEMDDRINKIAFPPIVYEMAKAHKGLFVWDASILINSKTGKMYFGEFCSNRLGYNAFFSELAQMPSVSHFFETVAAQKNPYTIGTVATSIRLFNMHRDLEKNEVLRGMNIAYKKEFEKNIWLWDAYKDKKDIVSAGFDKNLAVITGNGKSIEEAVNMMYKTVEKGFSFVGVYYRPKFDYLSLDYQTSILNRLNYGVDRKLYQLPFRVVVGDIIDR